MDLSRKITINTLTQIIGRVGVIFLSLISTALLTRRLGKAGYGAFGLINTSVVIFFSLADWGTNFIAVREAARQPKKTSLILGNCLILRTLMAVFATWAFILFIFLNQNFNQFRQEALISSLIILFFSLKTTAQIIFHAQLKLYLNSLVEFFGTLVFLLLLILYRQHFSLTSVIFFLTLSAFFNAVLALLLTKKLTSIKLRLEFNLIKQLLKESLPMGALLFTFSIYNRIDSFILQASKGVAVTGLYLFAYKIHENLILGAAYLMNAFFPVIANSFNQSIENQNQPVILQKAFDLLLLMAIPLVVIFFIFAPLVVNLIAGREFSPAVTPLRILLLATGMAYLNHLTGYSLIAIGKQAIHLRFCLIALVFNIILNLLFIPHYSLIAAAITTVLTESLIFVLTFSYLKRKLNWKLSFLNFPQTLFQLLIRKGKIF